jgi:rhamnosyltransferase
MNRPAHITTDTTPSELHTACLVVTFNPDETFPERLQRIIAQTSKVVVVNNGPREPVATYLATINCTGSEISLLQNNKNMGLGFALNQGVEYCQASGYQWVLLLDQDSMVTPDIVSVLGGISTSIPEQVAIIGSNYRSAESRSALINCSGSAKGSIQRTTVITSGSLLRLDAYSEIGPFRSDYFIDSIDHEYCLRARKHGYLVTISCKPVMTHNIGITTGTQNKMTDILRAPQHAVARKYYITRNTILTIKQYWGREITWSLKQIFRLLFETSSIILFEKSKIEKLSAMKSGLLDGFRGKSGQGPLDQ